MSDSFNQFFEGKSRKTSAATSNTNKIAQISFEQKEQKQQKTRGVLVQMNYQLKKEPNLKYQFKRLQMQKKIVDEELIKLKQRYQKELQQKNAKIQELKKNVKSVTKDFQNQVKINKQLAKGYKQQQEKIATLQEDLQKTSKKQESQLQTLQKQYGIKFNTLKSQKQELQTNNQNIRVQLDRFRKEKEKQKAQTCQIYEQKLKQVNSKLQIKVKQLKIVQDDLQVKREQTMKLQKQSESYVNEFTVILHNKNQKIQQLQKSLQVLQSTLVQLENAQNSINQYERKIGQKQNFLQGFVSQYEQLTLFIQQIFDFNFPFNLDLKGMIQFIHKQFLKEKDESFIKLKAKQHAFQQISYKMNILIEENNFLKTQLEENKSFNKIKERQIFLMGQKAEQLRKIRESHQMYQQMDIERSSNFHNQKDFKLNMRNGSLPNLKSMVYIQNEKNANKILKYSIKQNIKPAPSYKCTMQDLILKKCKDIVF